VAVAEGAWAQEQAEAYQALVAQRAAAESSQERARLKAEIKRMEVHMKGSALRLARQLEEKTGLESRLTILGHLQRGGIPSAADRLLSTRLGTACVEFIQQERYGIMVAARGDGCEAVPLEEVAGKVKLIPPDHPWIHSARAVSTCLGD